MGRLSILEETNVPATPSEGNTLYSTVATPSLLRVKDDAGNVYTLSFLEKAQTFTVAQVIAPTATNADALKLNMPASTTGRALEVNYNATLAARIVAVAAATQFQADTRDMGNNAAGCLIQSGRNSSAGAEGGAAGTLSSVRAGGGSRFIWADAASDWRTHTAQPTGSSGSPTVADNAGTVVGTQTSWYAEKENIEEHETRDDLLTAVLAAKLYDYQMIADDQRRSDNSRQTYTGLVITENDKENDAWFANNMGDQQIPVLNERNLFGYLIGAIQAQQAQISQLTQRITELEEK